MKIKLFLILVLVFFPVLVLAVDPAATPAPTANSATGCQGSATVYCLNAPLPGLPSVTVGAGANPFLAYLKTWYSFIVGSVGIIATVMIMYAGLKWLTSRGNSSTISDAKTKIWSAIIGLLLAFFSYTILFYLNPALVKITTPGADRLMPISFSQNYKVGDVTFSAVPVPVGNQVPQNLPLAPVDSDGTPLPPEAIDPNTPFVPNVQFDNNGNLDFNAFKTTVEASNYFTLPESDIPADVAEYNEALNRFYQDINKEINTILDAGDSFEFLLLNPTADRSQFNFDFENATYNVFTTAGQNNNHPFRGIVIRYPKGN